MGEIIDKVKKNIKSKIYNEVRQLYLKKSICNLGKIVEIEDRIICYVDQKSIDRYKEYNQFYKLSVNGINQITDSTKQTVEKFGLNKPVYYIFDGIEFTEGVRVTSLWANIIFRNCIFDKNIGIIWGDEITFENNIYKDRFPSYFYGNCFLTTYSINKLTFINDNFSNSCDWHHPTKFGMKIDAKLVEFINTKVDKVDDEYPAIITIEAEKTKFENSSINADEVYIDSKSIDFSNSSVIAQKGVMIENANCDFVGEVKAPTVFYNGIDLTSKTQELQKVSEDQATLKNARHKLIEKLRNLSSYCQQLNDDRVQNIKDKLNNQTIVKTIKQR